MTLPTFKEIEDFIVAKPRATICEIRDHFGKRGNYVCFIKKNVLAYGIDKDFLTHLREFLKNPFVEIELDILACLCSDETKYTGKGKFLPIVLTIKH